MRDEEARTAWREAVASLDPAQFVFVDESGTHTSLTRLYGWAPHDQRATGSVPRNHGKNTTLVAALTPEGLRVPWLIEGAMNTPTFAWYIAEQLGPTLRPGQVRASSGARSCERPYGRQHPSGPGGARL